MHAVGMVKIDSGAASGEQRRGARSEETLTIVDLAPAVCELGQREGALLTLAAGDR